MCYRDSVENKELYRKFKNEVLSGLHYKRVKQALSNGFGWIRECRYCTYFMQETDYKKIDSLPQFASGFCKNNMWLNRWIGHPNYVHKEVKHISEYKDNEYCEKLGDVIDVVKPYDAPSYKRIREYGVYSNSSCSKFSFNITKWQGIYHPVFVCEMTAEELAKFLSLSKGTIHNYARNGMSYKTKYQVNEGWSNPSFTFRYFKLEDIIPWLEENKPKYVSKVKKYVQGCRNEYQDVLKAYNNFINSIIQLT